MVQSAHRPALPVDRQVRGIGQPLYIYAINRDFRPFFLKFCTYFPYNGELCLNGHEYAKP